jgi:hypothetical protein
MLKSPQPFGLVKFKTVQEKTVSLGSVEVLVNAVLTSIIELLKKPPVDITLGFIVKLCDKTLEANAATNKLSIIIFFIL